MRTVWLLSALLAVSFSSFAEKKKAETSDDLIIRPVVSPSGIQRIYENIDLLKKTVRDAEANANLCEKNRETVLMELQDLEKLEQEQHSLIKDYEKYIENAKLQMQRNDAGLQEISKWEADNRGKLGNNANSKNQMDLATKLQTARADKLSRERWSTDARSKVARVERLITSAKHNLVEIQKHRASIRSQAAGWSAKRREFEGMIKGLLAKKVDLERLAEVKKKELPHTDDGEGELE